MGRTRLEFQAFLETLKGDRNVYYQPPPTFVMSFPAIVYDFDTQEVVHADDIKYLKSTCYKLIYITKLADDPMVETLSELPYCSIGRKYVSDNLHHFPYTIYF